MSDFTPADLPRVAERIPYLYLEQCVIKRMNNALVAADENGETQLPIATIAVLMLGPGTTITHDAVVFRPLPQPPLVPLRHRGPVQGGVFDPAGFPTARLHSQPG